MTKIYTPLHCHSHFSLLDGLSKPKDIVDRLDNIGANTCALTDHGSISGAVQFFKAMQKAKHKPILGCEFYVTKESAKDHTPENKKLSHQVILAKNLDGWRDLLKLISYSNEAQHFYYKPRIDWNALISLNSSNLISFSGHLGSTLANIIVEGNKLSTNWLQDGCLWAQTLSDMFGKENFYLEVQLIDSKINKLAGIVGEAIREISKETGIPCVATPDAHYCKREDAIDQRILLCNTLKTTFREIKKKIKNEPDFSLSSFFLSDNYHIPTYEEMREFHTEEELENTNEIANECEEYTILSNPILPTFSISEDLSPSEALRKLCIDGWRRLMGHLEKGSKDFKLYGERVKKELRVIEEAELSSYFLIVQDICNFVRSKDLIMGAARGSSAGCLVSYLTGITSIDPIPYDLLFERFYNVGRNTKDNKNLCDIDLDVSTNAREMVINYLKEKYGKDKVAQIITFQTMKGRGSLKRVLNSYGEIGFDEQNEITKSIVDEAKIADELQEMDEPSIIRWALENKANDLKNWCYINDDGNLDGPLADKFEQAIRLEGTKIAKSLHPSGVIVSPIELNRIAPLVLDTDTKEQIIGFEGPDSEACGLVKIDILGIATLDKMMDISKLLKGEDI